MGRKAEGVKVLLVHPRCNDYKKIIKERFPGLNLVVAPEESKIDEDITDAEVVVAFELPNTLPKLKNLKWYQALSAGVDHLLKSKNLPKNVLLTNAAGVASTPVSEFVISYMLYFVKKYSLLSEKKRKKDLTPLVFDELYGKTVGILGLGHLGGAIAQKAKAFQMKVIGYDKYITQREHVDKIYSLDQLEEVLKHSDFLVIALPLTKETNGFIGEAELRKMKKSAYLINIARGEILEKEAILLALREGWIAGCALDVFWSQKDSSVHTLEQESILWNMGNVILTPHSVAVTPMYVTRSCELFCDNLNRYLEGGDLRNVVDRESLELDG